MDFIKIPFLSFFKAHLFGISLLSIIVLSFFLRFYNYENRWGLAADQARDVIIAREAIRAHSIPMIGPFASAGQFVYGPQWYWILMVMVGLFPFAVITPWIIQTLLFVGIIWLMIRLGEELENKWFGLLLGLFTAISTAQIMNSTNLTQPSIVGIFSFLALYFFIKYIKNSTKIYAFLLAFTVATAVNIHFQAIGLLVLIPLAFIFDNTRNIRKALIMLIGTTIPFIPLIYFDLTNNFFESRNLIDYYLYGQYRIYIPNRWLTYVGVYWPDAWSKIIGGKIVLGYIITVSLVLGVTFAFFKKKLKKTHLAIIVAFLIIFFLLRYFRGERIESYLVFLHPFILFLTGWTCLQLYRFKKVVGISLFLIIFFLTVELDILEINKGENLTAIQAKNWTNKLKNDFLKDTFAVFDYKLKDRAKSFPLVLYLEQGGKINDNGKKIGFYIATSETNFDHPAIIGSKGTYQILNLDSSTSAQLSKEGWALINPSQIYRSTIEWYKK